MGIGSGALRNRIKKGKEWKYKGGEGGIAM